MFCGFDFSLIKNVPSLSLILSYSEMLEKTHPRISAALQSYAMCLIENEIFTLGPNPELEKGFNLLKSRVEKSVKANPEELEIFADKILALNTKSNDVVFLAYVCYTSISQFKLLSPEITKKITSIQDKISEPSGPTPILLAEIARNCFKNQNYDLSMAALLAAISELEKGL